MTKRENLYHHNKKVIKMSRTGSVKFAVVYDDNGKAHDCWDMFTTAKQRQEIKDRFNKKNLSI